MSDITFVGRSSAIAAGTGAVTPAMPAGFAVGDLLICAQESYQLPTVLPVTSGGYGTWAWTPSPYYAVYSNSTSTTYLTLAYKFVSSLSEATVTVADTGDHTVAMLYGFRGVDTALPFDGVTPCSDSYNTSIKRPTTFGSITTNTDNCLIACFGGNTKDADYIGTNLFTSFFSGGNLASQSVPSGAGGFSQAGYGGGIGFAYGVLPTAGATGNIALVDAYYGFGTGIMLCLRQATAISINYNTFKRMI